MTREEYEILDKKVAEVRDLVLNINNLEVICERVLKNENYNVRIAPDCVEVRTDKTNFEYYPVFRYNAEDLGNLQCLLLGWLKDIKRRKELELEAIK